MMCTQKNFAAVLYLVEPVCKFFFNLVELKDKGGLILDMQYSSSVVNLGGFMTCDRHIHKNFATN